MVAGYQRGNLVTDADLTAPAIGHRVGVCSADSEFASFPQTSWVNPILLSVVPGRPLVPGVRGVLS